MNLPRLSPVIKTLALLVFAATLPFGLKPFFLVNNLSLFLLGFNWLFENSFADKKTQLKQNAWVLTYVTYFVLYIIGTFYSTDHSTGWFIVEKKLPLLLLPVFLASGSGLTTKQVKWIAIVFVSSVLAAMIICLGVAVQKNLNEGHTPAYIYNALVHGIHLPGRYLYFNYWYFTNKLLALPVMMHPVYFAMYIICAAVLFHWLQVGTAKKAVIYLKYGFWLLGLIMIVFLSSRMQLFCALVLLLVFGVSYAIKTGKVVKVSILAAVLLAGTTAIVVLNPVIRERIIQSNTPGTHFSENKYGEGGLSLRTYKWKYTLETIKQFPLFGAGTGDSQHLLEKTYLEHHFEIGIDNHFNPHNQYLQAMLDLGFVGLSALLAIIAALIVVAYRQGNYWSMTIIFVSATSLLTESMLEVNKGIVFFAFFPPLFRHLATKTSGLLIKEN